MASTSGSRPAANSAAEGGLRLAAERPVVLIRGYGELSALKEVGETRILQKPYTDSDLVGKDHASIELR
jgi:hypothetical protein